MTQESETDPLNSSKSQNDTNCRDYLLGIVYALASAFLYAVSCLMLKNIRNQKGQQMRYEEILPARALVFLPAALLTMSVYKISLFGLESKTYLILNLLGMLCTIAIHCYNMAYYSMSVGDVRTIGFLSIISIMVFERIFRRKEITLWKVIFSTGVIIGGGLVAQPTFGNEDLSKNYMEGGHSTLLGNNYHSTASFLTNKMVGLLILVIGFNCEAVSCILTNMVNGISPALIIFHMGVWKILMFPLSQMLLPSLGRLLTMKIYDFIQYDLVYHIGMSFGILFSWITAIFSLQKIPTILYMVVLGLSLVFDYGGQAIIDGTMPNNMALWGIFITVASVILFVMEKMIFNNNPNVKREADLELYP